jgi:hypothetical protein
MLTISKTQMQALAADRRRRFEARLLASLRPTVLAEVADDTAAADLVRRGVDHALRDFSSEEDVARYVGLLLRHLDAWQLKPPADGLEMLRNTALPTRRRLDNFERWATQWSATHGHR